MAVGPFVRIIAQLAIPIARAFAVAYQQALSNARREGAKAARDTLTKKRMTTQEATEILNLTEADARDVKVVDENFRRIFQANDPKNGGSFYLQSKIYSAQQTLIKAQEGDQKGSSSNSS